MAHVHHSQLLGLRATRALTRALGVAVLGSLATSAWALDLQMSGFGTAGVAVSNQPYRYQRFINDSGTLKRDSVLGAQLDAKFSPEWSATVQGKVAPALDDDSKWKASLAWAFLSWRPNNDWLVRAGKVRLPLYLYSENLDVGQSYEFVRMPTEMYSISPTTDIAGLYLTHNWAFGPSDLSLDVYSGRSPRVVQRIHTRDSGTYFEDVSTRVSGAVLTFRSEDSTWRAGLHHAASKFNGAYSAPTDLYYQPVGGNLGLYVPGRYADHFSNDILTLGLDLNLSNHWRLITEFERNVQHDIDLGANTAGGYVSLLRRFDKLTPYVTVSMLKSLGKPDRLYGAISQNLPYVPSFIPDAVAGQNALVDSMPHYDQHSLALGASYALTPQSKLKAEWLHTWVRDGSVMVDSPAGAPPVAHDGIDVLSLSYNFAF